jgi:replicative DNA helicase
MHETELQILNSATINRNACDKVMALDKSYFFIDSSKKIFQVIHDLYCSGQEIDLPSISVNIEDKRIITELAKSQTVRNIDYLIQQLKDRKHRHEIQMNATDLYHSVKDGMEYEEFVNNIIALNDSKNSQSDDWFDLSDFDGLELKKIFQRSRYLKTGIDVIDEKIVGLFRKHISIIAGRPGLGKTTLALQIAKQYKTLFFSLEMTRQELYSKLLSADSDVEVWKIETRRYNEAEEKRVFESHKKMCTDLNITVFDQDASFGKIINYMNSMVRMKKPELVVVDHIGLIGGAPGENENARLTNISRSLKLVAMRNDISMLVLSQFSRDVEKNRREPVLSDLRGSGSLEQDAGLVLFLHEDKDEDFKIICAKNKKGRTGNIKEIIFDKQYSRFEEYYGVT